MNEPIIQSLLDTDLYKLTMMQAILHQHPGAQARFAFRARSRDVDLRPLAGAVRAQVDHLGSLRATAEELAFLRTRDYLSVDFVDFLRVFRLDPGAVEVRADRGMLEIVAEGTWLHVGPFEVPILAIVAELYGRTLAPDTDVARTEGERRLDAKVELIRRACAGRPDLPFRLFEFGTRRRFSRAWQERLVGRLATELPDQLWGTSNVDLARRHGLRPVGTFAHEWVMAHQALGPRLGLSQVAALDGWAREFRGRLGIALSDTVGFGAFLDDFDLYFAKLFDGVRQDSGDPAEVARRLIAHYRGLGLDPATKALVFSNALDVPGALALWGEFEGMIMTSFGIGTNLSNDVGVPALAAVLKMETCEGLPVAKLSDEPAKATCPDPAHLRALARAYGMDLLPAGDPPAVS